MRCFLTPNSTHDQDTSALWRLPICQCALFARHVAKSVLPIWTAAYPNDTRPQEALAITWFRQGAAGAEAVDIATKAAQAAAKAAQAAAYAANAPYAIYAAANAAYAAINAAQAAAEVVAAHAANVVNLAAYAAARAAAHTASNAANAAANAVTNAAYADVPNAAYAAHAACTKWEWIFELYSAAYNGDRIFPRAWVTADIRAIAHGIVDTEDFTSMPILADALDDAGCNDAVLLAHLRTDSNLWGLCDWTLYNLAKETG